MPDDEEMNRRLIDFAESADCRFWSVDFAELSPPERVFGVIWELESEVNNGGFQQYFLNSSGACVPEVVGALKAIAANKAAELVERAIETVGPGIQWADHEARQEKIDVLPEATLDALDKLDQAFMAYPDNLTALLYEYVCDHRQEIGAPEDF
ncbi:MAG TPA: DMP19 family protein [Stellaceae bacterium]|jgi:hypothetical protein|nr:DMP19 family protein [Stellaceae bacterium]